MALSDEKLTAAIKLWNDGKSAGEIAEMLKVTRNVINGAMYRARKRGMDVKQKGPTKPALVKVKVEPKQKAKKVEAIKEPTVLLQLVAEVKPQELTVYRLQQGQCKYPTHFSADNEQLFCGKATEKSYCPEHHRLCHTYREPLKLKYFSKIK